MFDFRLSDLQIMLKDNVKDFVKTNCTPVQVREIMESAEGYSAKLWQDIADLGWLGITTPEEYSGMGMEFLDLAVVSEEMGKALMPGPFIESMLAVEAIKHGESLEQKKRYLPEIASGRLIATVAFDGIEGFVDLQAIPAVAQPVPEGYEVSGTFLSVPYASAAGLIVCPARLGEQGLVLLLIDPKSSGVEIESMIAMDGTYRLGAMKLAKTIVPSSQVLGDTSQSQELLNDLIQKAAILASADLLGGAEKALEMTADYGKERKQFDRFIGSFQAIKHRCADMLVSVENSRGLVYYAAWAKDQKLQDAELAASMAKAYCSEDCVEVSEKALQSFGGIGFTWEHDIHLYLKRARRLELAFGDAVYHHEKIARLWL